jgi:hypothetical protein
MKSNRDRHLGETPGATNSKRVLDPIRIVFNCTKRAMPSIRELPQGLLRREVAAFAFPSPLVLALKQRVSRTKLTKIYGIE